MTTAARSKPVVIGLAGGVGAGKSAVAGALERLGCVRSDADAAVRTALRDPAIVNTLKGWWGEGVVAADGAADRSAIASIVFQDESARRRLEGLLHPIAIETHRGDIERAAAQGAVAVVIDAPLLFEAGVDEMCDAVIFVEAPREQRVERVARDRGWDAEELDRRERSQASLERKRAGSEHVVINDAGLDEVFERTRVAFDAIMRSVAKAG